MSVKVRMDGFDDMRRKLETLKRRVSSLSGPVAFEDLFRPEFMWRYTDCRSIDEFFTGSGLKIDSQEDFDALSERDLDPVVHSTTRFKTWTEMKAKAGEEYMERRLNLEDL